MVTLPGPSGKSPSRKCSTGPLMQWYLASFHRCQFIASEALRNTLQFPANERSCWHSVAPPPNSDDPPPNPAGGGAHPGRLGCWGAVLGSELWFRRRARSRTRCRTLLCFYFPLPRGPRSGGLWSRAWWQSAMRRAVLRLCTLSKGLLTPGRGLTQGSQNPEDQRVFHIHEARSPIHVNHVRDKLREIVGASTNWRDHVKALEERKLLHSFLAKSQEELPPRRMKDSYVEVLLPLGSQPELREKYLTVQNAIRFGRILEDLDSLGVLICYMHTKMHSTKMSPLSIVTALVDKIDMHKKSLSPEQDIKFSGHVSWVGKTSMEVKMQMFQLHGNEFCPVLEATFVMVARDSENKRSAFVNPLIPEGPKEEELFRQGELNKGRRVAFSSASLLKMAPSAEERMTVHEMFLNTLDPKTISFRSRVLPPNAVWMENSKLKSLEICHPQERNIFNRIFGGFLMRKAYELGWATACNFGGSRPFVVAVDDIMFQKPVEVGSLLFLSSQVCYTQGNYIQVRVHSEVATLPNKEHTTTNVFHFTFMSEKEVPLVFPRTYGESMLYLDGQRHFNSMSTPVTLRSDYLVEP